MAAFRTRAYQQACTGVHAAISALKMQGNANDPFEKLISDIISSESYRSMREYKHHMRSTAYAHSIRVAYLCYRHCQRHNSRADLNELVRGALLHDYYLYDRRGREHHVNGLIHTFTHPKQAIKNAMRDYPDLTENERDAIRHHMFPMTLIPPKTRCGWLVCFYDKLAAIEDYCGRGGRTDGSAPGHALR